MGTELFKETYFASYDKAWDSDMHYGCLCDQGYRGPSCALVECPSANDPLDDKCDVSSTGIITDYQLQYDAPFGGAGWEQAYSLKSGKTAPNNEQQDCSGRGICDYSSGTCKCFSGYAGTACEKVEEMS